MTMINGAASQVNYSRTEAGASCKKDLDFSDGVNTPLEVAMTLPADLLTLSTAGNVGGNKGAIIEGEITDCKGGKETFKLKVSSDVKEYVKGHYGASEIKVGVTGSTEEGAIKLAGYVGPPSENPENNQEYYLTPMPGGFNLKGTVNGIPIEQSLELNPASMGLDVKGSCGGVDFSTKVWTADDMKSQPLEGTFGAYQQTGKGYMNEKNQVVLERTILEKAEDGSMQMKYNIVERFTPLK